jgi:acetaldehyde dehydrogenase (acetylating)
VSLIDKDLISIQEARSLAKNAKKAQVILSVFDEKQIDRILVNMVGKAMANATKLAEMAVLETGFGKIKDKTAKNEFASATLYEYIKDLKTVGIINEDKDKQVIEIAEPMGVLMGIIPSTNPTSTVIFKSLIAIKSRNAIVFSPHPSALQCTLEAAKLMHDAAVEAGAPEGIIACISVPTMEGTDALMHTPEIALIIATGGSAMVKASYSAGKPALGVGPGNVPAYIERTADISKAVRNIIASKTFDNGTICASEQSVIVEYCIRDAVIAEFKKQGGYFMSEEETKTVSKELFTGTHAMNSKLMGRTPQDIATKTGISIPNDTVVLLGEQKGVGKEYPLSYEKLTTVLAFYSVEDWKEACELCLQLLNNGGIGHSISIHTEDRDMVLKFATKPVFRILVNTPSSQGGVGLTTGLPPSFTLGCGTWGGSSTSDNVSPLHLINIKRVAYGIKEVNNIMDSSSSKGSKANISQDQITAIVSEVIRRLEK